MGSNDDPDYTAFDLLVSAIDAPARYAADDLRSITVYPGSAADPSACAS